MVKVKLPHTEILDGVCKAPFGGFHIENFVSTSDLWRSFLLSYGGEDHVKEIKRIHKVPADSDCCEPKLAKKDGFVYLYYKDENGDMRSVAFTVDKVADDDWRADVKIDCITDQNE